MLTRSLALVGSTVATVLMSSPAARADSIAPKPPVITVAGDPRSGTVSTTVTAPGTTSTQAGGPSGKTWSDDVVTCSWKVEPSYSQQVFQWLGSDPNGTWYDVTCSDGSSYNSVYVPPSAANLPPAVALAGTLARTVANRLPLPSPRVRRNPEGPALVGLATWWWVDPGQWQPLRQRTQAGPVWAEVTATPVSTTWDAGDGSEPLVCAGPGTPYDTTLPAQVQATNCSHTYRRTTADQPQTGPSVNDRFFTVTVTTSWQVTWVGSGGSGGALPLLTTSSSFPLAIAQRQTVVTGGSG